MVDYIQRRASMDGDSANQNGECDHEESELDFLAQKQEEALAPVTEDLMDWLAKTLGQPRAGVYTPTDTQTNSKQIMNGYECDGTDIFMR